MTRFRYLLMGVAAAALLLSCGEENKIQGGGTTNGGNNGGGSGTVNPPAEDNRGPFDNEIGKPLSAWAEGCLDIHAINSGRGECTFYIMPDGTTMCVDAGEIGPNAGEHSKVDQKPNANIRPFRVYGEYIKYFLPGKVSYMDYMLMTHFHNDHFGSGNEATFNEISKGGMTWRQTGIMAVYDIVPFDKMIDRAYSSNDKEYKWVAESGGSVSSGVDSYANFIYWARTAKGLRVERAKNGSTTQIKMVNDAAKYPTFKVQINAVNGEYWNGSESIDPYGESKPAENGNSISFLMSYGNFDYLASGDAGANTKIENNLAKSINKKIEAMKSHHHFSWDTMSATSMKIYQPKVVVSQSFYDHQPDMGHSWTCGGMSYASNSNQAFQKAWASYGADEDKNWYFTNIHPKTAEVYPAEVAKVRSRNGHVVIRVKEGGSEFYVYVLDDTDSKYNVKQIDGPFSCHK